MTKDEMRDAWLKVRGRDIDTDCSCCDCPVNSSCEYAFDLYNSDGDCLAMK
jgi:hypothetical protein